MPEKKEIKRVNPKWLLRQIMNSLPAEAWVRSTVAALWTYCNDFIQEEDIANGTVVFSGTVAYSQLAQLLAIGESTARWRMTQLRDEYQLVEWEGTKLGIEFTISISLSRTASKRCDHTRGWRMPSTPAQQACQRRAGHIWTDYLHTTQQCSACGKIRPNLPPWTAEDDLEAEYMAWLEEDAPDNWNPFESLWAYPSQRTSLIV